MVVAVILGSAVLVGTETTAQAPTADAGPSSEPALVAYLDSAAIPLTGDPVDHDALLELVGEARLAVEPLES